jgi:hypothetical protein
VSCRVKVTLRWNYNPIGLRAYALPHSIRASYQLHHTGGRNQFNKGSFITEQGP